MLFVLVCLINPAFSQVDPPSIGAITKASGTLIPWI